jgi:ATP/maltotriose-dependent transcriptional regulator MalT
MRANLALAGMYVKLGMWDSARAHVDQALPIMENKPYFLPYMTKAKKVQADIAHGTGNSLSELSYLSSYMVLNDSLERMQDRQRVLRVSWQWEAEKYRRSIKDADLRRKQVNLTFLFVVGFVVLFLLIIILSVNGSKNKIRLKNAELEGEHIRMAFQKELVERELGELQNSLQEFTRTIQQNDQTIQRLRNEVIRNLDNFPEKQETLSENIEEIMGEVFMNEERWTKFQDIFERVYPGYLDLQKQSFQPLSQKELRLLALIKLGLNNRSMASLLGITLEGVKKAKQRLKKKQ